MSELNSEGVNKIETNDETHSLTGQELGHGNSAGNNQSTCVTSKEVALQIKAVIDPLDRQLQITFNLKRRTPSSPSQMYRRRQWLDPLHFRSPQS